MDKLDVPSTVAHIDFLVANIDFLVRPKFGKRATDHKEVEAYRKELCALQREELQARYEKEQEQDRIEQQAEADLLEAQWFFHQPGAAADFEHWSKAAHWTLDEAIALSFGKAPEFVSWENVKWYVGISPFVGQYARMRDLALRAKRCQQLDDPVFPGIFLGWAKRTKIEYPAELETQVVARGHQIADWRSLHDGLQAQYNELKAQYDDCAEKVQSLVEENKNLISSLTSERDSLCLRVAELEQAPGQGQAEKQLLTRERATALKLIIGMAVVGYKYDSKAKRSNTISEIVGDLDSAGVSLDADTVRKWLREAADLLPREGLDNKDR